MYEVTAVPKVADGGTTSNVQGNCEFTT